MSMCKCYNIYSILQNVKNRKKRYYITLNEYKHFEIEISQDLFKKISFNSKVCIKKVKGKLLVYKLFSELPTHARGDGLGFGSQHSY